MYKTEWARQQPSHFPAQCIIINKPFMNILGLSAFYHESACCLLQNGQLITAVSEERFSRVKHDPRLPVRAYRYCLQNANLNPAQLDAIAYYENPSQKAARQKASGLTPADAQRPEQLIREQLGFDGPILTFNHHLSHAASTYYFSGYDEAAIFTMDGVGEWATTSYGHGLGDDLTLIDTVNFPHSLGLFYATITAYLGFRVNNGEYKVMGLAAYGRPRYVAQMRQLLQNQAGSQFRLNMDYFSFAGGDQMYSPALSDLLDHEPRQPDGEIEPFHQDIAHSAQKVLEEVVLQKVNYLAEQIPSTNLCLAGGVALNCVANGRIRRESQFTNIFIQPAAGDAGACLGAAALAHRQLSGKRPYSRPQKQTYLGPQFTTKQIEKIMTALDIPTINYQNQEEKLMNDIAERLADGQIVGWFEGSMEFGPRALGHRSILADPRHAEMRQILNQRVKRRELFRPFAPAVLQTHAADHFDLQQESPFMLETCQVISPLALPAITHVDGSARPQTVDPTISPRFAALLNAFYQQTGCPILLNTSFNMRGEPIVNTPIDAIFCFINAQLDLLLLQDFLLERAQMPGNWEQLLGQWDRSPRFAFAQQQSAISETLYTFV